MSEQRAQPIHRHDYTPPAYWVETTELEFTLGEDETQVRAKSSFVRNAEQGIQPLELVGEELELVELRLDGKRLQIDEYLLRSGFLRIAQVPERFELEITTRIKPQLNTALQGLYKSGGMFCTQCEAEGFRRITYFLDRPDVMARFTTTIVADKTHYPVLLSNGNPVARGELEDGRHWVRWEDPFRKPSYLFALVAGDLSCRRDSFTTASGRKVDLEIYVEPQNLEQTAYALDSLQRSMRWDEQTYGLEYDLDIYMIVAVGDFNMGAMENKGLNIFNTACVLASPATATDADYETVEAVIGHEYFHNWTGNRVTCRDWFQLSLKEGLTVFREQQFCGDMGSSAVKRINEVRILRSAQFPEDAGPMAHPVRPDEYVEINNFYTPTVYQKGAEVIRMYHTLLGAEGFRRGMDLYIERHDGQAVTCDDFLAAMADANDADLSQFSLWYSQAGTPVLDVEDDYDPASQRYTLKVKQSCPATPGQAEKQPFHLPLTIGLLGHDGQPLALNTDGGTQQVLEVREPEQSYTFTGIAKRPVPSLLRGFSAPVQLNYDYSDADLAFLFAHDDDEFTRWEAGQRLASKLILGRVTGEDGIHPEALFGGAHRTLTQPDLDPAFAAEALTLPSEAYLAEQMAIIDPLGIHEQRQRVRRELAGAHQQDWQERYLALAESGGTAAQAAAQRRLKNVCLAYLASLGTDEAEQMALTQFERAEQMTDSIAALSLLADSDSSPAQHALDSFYQRWQHEPLVVDKWFRVQALSSRADTLERVRALTAHPAFALTNPNKVRALIGAFSHGNPARFHAADGSGYRFLADHVIALNAINPQIAARLVTALSRWRRYDEERQKKMKFELERILRTHQLSNDVSEIVSRSLAD